MNKESQKEGGKERKEEGEETKEKVKESQVAMYSKENKLRYRMKEPRNERKRKNKLKKERRGDDVVEERD